MSAQTDTNPAVPTSGSRTKGVGPLSRPVAQAVSAKDEKRARKARGERDLELLAAVRRGDNEAIATLAERMAPRVERIARALMGGLRGAAVDADDAALHALIELLRSHASYRGKEPLERWGDRIAALSVVRFARAVSRRSSAGESVELAAGRLGAPGGLERDKPRDQQNARTFEQYLQTLSDPARQTLLLRHALGLKVSELADALQCSTASAKQQLLEARVELRSLIRRRGGTPAPLGVGATRWCELRDREALGDALRADELEELLGIETRDTEVWAFVAQVRALELYFEGARAEPATLSAATWVVRAIAALQVTSPPPAPPRASGTLESHQIRDLEGSRTVRYLALGASVMLAASTVVALIYRPGERAGLNRRESGEHELLEPASMQAALAPEPARLRPTVEALPRVTTAPRGVKLRRDGKLLLPGTLIAQGDTVDTLDRPACLQIEPDSDVCLGFGSALRLVSISAQKRQFELLRGRVVVRVGPQSEATRMSVRAGELEVSAGRAVFTLERGPDGKLLRVRALKGPLEARAADASRELGEGKSLSFRAPASFEAAQLSASIAQRDWEVLALGLHPALAGAVHPAGALPHPATAPEGMFESVDEPGSDSLEPEPSEPVPAPSEDVTGGAASAPSPTE